MKNCSTLLSALGALALVFSGCDNKKPEVSKAAKQSDLPQPPCVYDCEPGVRGGRLVIATFGDPKTFNPITENEGTSREIIRFLFAGMVSLDWPTQKATPGLAHSWSVADDKKTWTWKLRSGLKWSDDQPLTADDVVFTWTQVIYNPDIVNVTRDLFTIDGKEFKVTKVDDLTVQVVTPEPYAPFIEYFGGVEILPKHILAREVAEKKFESAYGINTAPARLVCSGPFKLKQYKAGEFTLLERNPNFFGVDKAGTRLPYLDNVIYTTVPDMNAMSLRFLKGESDIHENVRPDEFDRFKTEADAGKFKLESLGIGPERAFMWFNLNTNRVVNLRFTSDQANTTLLVKSAVNQNLDKLPSDGRVMPGELELVAKFGTNEHKRVVAIKQGQALPLTVKFDSGSITIAGAKGETTVQSKPIVDPKKMAWFGQPKFRQAIAHAIDRPSIIKSIYAGRADEGGSFVSSALTKWHNPNVPKYPYDVAKARALLKEIGIEDRNGDGFLEDAQGHVLEFSFNTNVGNNTREKVAVFIQSDLKKLGVKLNYKPIDFNALVSMIDDTFDYDAILLGLGGGGTDPAANMNVLKSDGFTHFWFPRQKIPATPWEAKVDKLMNDQLKELDEVKRKAIFNEVQVIMSTEMPFIYTIQPLTYAAYRKDLGNIRPTVLSSYRVTWNAEELYLKKK